MDDDPKTFGKDFDYGVEHHIAATKEYDEEKAAKSTTSQYQGVSSYTSNFTQLQSDDWKNPLNNPHVFQVLPENNPGLGYESRTDIPFTRILNHDFPRRKYRRRKDEMKSCIHWGQRKLLLSEIEFLTMYGNPKHPVVYAGAAPGTHLKQLAAMFPKYSFVGVDPANFTVKETSKILLRQELFTDEIAKEFAGKSPLFICDIRSADPTLMNDDENEDQIKEDMDAQLRWHNIMKPLKSMLKFRLSWRRGKTPYLDGDLYLPVYGPITTTEGRLIPSSGMKNWDNMLYEEQFFYFNTVVRVSLYPHTVYGEGLDHCYDCMTEIVILHDYLKKVKGMKGNLDAEIAQLSKHISRSIAGGRTLLSGNCDPGQRKAGISVRQYVDGKPAYMTAKEERKRQKDGLPDEDDAILEPKKRRLKYGDFAEDQLSKMGYSGKGLGVKEDGNEVPVPSSNQIGMRGLGFKPQDALDTKDSNMLSGFVKSSVSTSQGIWNDGNDDAVTDPENSGTDTPPPPHQKEEISSHQPQGALLGGSPRWTVAFSKRENRLYFYDTKTGESKWDIPHMESTDNIWERVDLTAFEGEQCLQGFLLSLEDLLTSLSSSLISPPNGEMSIKQDNCKKNLSNLSKSLTKLSINLSEVQVVDSKSSEGDLSVSPKIPHLKQQRDDLVQQVQQKNLVVKGLIDRLRAVQLDVATMISSEPTGTDSSDGMSHSTKDVTMKST